MAKTIGQAAYEKWTELVIHPPTWPWDALPVSAKAGWEEIALAAVNQHIDDGETAMDKITERLDAQMGESDG